MESYIPSHKYGYQWRQKRNEIKRSVYKEVQIDKNFYSMLLIFYITTCAFFKVKVTKINIRFKI